MHKNLTSAFIATSIVSVAMLQGCATKIKATSTSNPAPSEAFSSFGRVELRPVVFKDGYRGDSAGLAKI
jgi:hypothetical protein